eukprot:GHVR01150868.1.p1 GENE.GHVR01150868.1~~GHVR01150868.1.p1  ORF type:complete len:199 (+),score=12.62 GHVR01150868.1:490-1086(+)
MGQEDDMIYQYAKSYTEGLQGKDGKLTGVLGSAKHFFADGATMYGADEGNAHVGSYKSFIKHNIQGYNGSISAEIGSVMCSYSSINWVPLSLSPSLQTILRQNLNFDGFVISDYDELNKNCDQGLPTDFQNMQLNESLSHMLAAGIDMFMIPGYLGRKGITDYFEAFKVAISNKTVSNERINDAVARILSVKFALGLV